MRQAQMDLYGSAVLAIRSVLADELPIIEEERLTCGEVHVERIVFDDCGQQRGPILTDEIAGGLENKAAASAASFEDRVYDFMHGFEEFKRLVLVPRKT